MDLVRFLAGALASFGLILATALVVGRWTLGPLPLRRTLESTALGATIGLGVVGTGLFGLGLFHLLRPGVLLVLAAAIHLAAAPWWYAIARRLWAALTGAPHRALLIATVLGVGLAPLVALALYPPTGYDATTYHLPYAHAFVRTGAVPFLEHVHPPIFPQLQELLFAAGLALGPDVVSHLLQLASTLLIGMLMLAWPSAPRVARLWATALWLGTPHVLWMSSAAYVDLGMTLQATAAVYAWTRAREDKGVGLRWWALAGVCAGFAAATKYLGLFFVVAGLGSALSAAVRCRRAWPVLAFGAAAAASAGPWYVRLYVVTGNPLFPFFSGWMGGQRSSSWDPGVTFLSPVVSNASEAWSVSVRVVEALHFLVLMPWNALVHREVFALQAPLTPYYLVLLPLLLPLAGARRPTRPLVGLSLVYAGAWLALTPRDLRYLLPIWPLVNLAMMDTAVAWLERRGPWLVRHSRAVLAMALILVAPGWVYVCYRLVRQGPVPVTPETRQAYLARTVPGYDAIAWLNRRHGADYTVYTLFGHRLTYYAEGRLRGAWAGPGRYDRMLQAMSDPATLNEELRRLGADYLLVVTSEHPVPVPDTTEWSAHFVLVHRGPEFTLYERARGRA